MTAILIDQGVDFFANTLKALINSPVVRLQLFQNDVTPTLETEFADLTVCTFSGYAHRPLTASISDPVQMETGWWRIKMTNPHTFAHDGGGTANVAYGWFINRLPSTLVVCERFITPVEMSDANHSIDVQPYLDLRSLNLF